MHALLYSLVFFGKRYSSIHTPLYGISAIVPADKGVREILGATDLPGGLRNILNQPTPAKRSPSTDDGKQAHTPQTLKTDALKATAQTPEAVINSATHPKEYERTMLEICSLS